MRKLKEMKKNNKGFSLVELIVVIAIMVVLVAVLGSTILGKIEESKYAKDIQALDSIDTAMSVLIADPNSDYSAAEDADGCTLADLMSNTKNAELAKILKEVFRADGTFVSSSKAFASATTSTVNIKVNQGAVSITVPAATGYDAYVSPKTS